jgi:hypothetical protein
MRPLIESLETRQLFAVNLLANGDFESPAIGLGASGQSYTTFATNATIGSGWKVTAGNVDVVSNTPGTYATKPASGKQMIDMNGLTAGTISQTATTIANHRYLLKFAWTATPFLGGGAPDLRKLDVQFGGKTIASLSKSAVGLTPANPGWAYSEYLVTASASTSTVAFLSKSAGSLGIALDNVTLTEVPFGTASISGQVFADGNGDGLKGVDAIGLGGWTVFIDKDADGKLDTNEIRTTTDKFGNYKIGNLAAGTYVVKIVQQTGWKLTSASSFTITLTSGQTVANKLFGEQPI